MMPGQIASSLRPSTSPTQSVEDPIGSYKILGQLGQGSFGTTFQALNLVTSEIVVLKVLFPFLTSDVSIRNRFLKMMRRLAVVSHPNLAGILDARQDGEHLVVVSHWSEGTNLAQCIDCDGPIPAELVYVIVRQAADALMHLHDNDHIHGRIKPSNILLTIDGDIKILDLGLARLCDDYNHGHSSFYIAEPGFESVHVRHLASVAQTLPGIEWLSATEAALSTIAYTAPEQLRNPSLADRRSDVFSLGSIAYQLLAGQPLDSSDQPHELLNRRLTCDDCLFTEHPLVTDGWKHIIKRMIAPNPEHRISSMTQLMRELDAMFEVPVPQGSTSFWKKLSHRCSRLAGKGLLPWG